MSKIKYLVKKNFKIIVKNRFSYLILFFLPMFIALFMGILFYNQTSYDISIGFVKLENNSLYDKYYLALKDDNLALNEYSEENSCTQALENGIVNICVIFPQNFEILDNKTNTVTLLFDNSKPNIIQAVKNIVLVDFEKQTFNIRFDHIAQVMLIVKKTKVLLEEQLKLTDEISFALNVWKENNAELKQKIVSLKSLMDDEGLDVAGLQDDYDDVLELKSNLAQAMDSYYANVKNDVDSLESKINKLDNASTDEKTGLSDKLDDIDAEVKSMVEETETFESKSAFNSVSSGLDDMEDKLDSVEIKILAIGQKVEQMLEENNKYNSKLKSRNTDITSVSDYLLDDISNLEINSANTLANPIVFESKNLIDEENSHISSFFPAFIAILILVLSLFFAANLAYVDKNKKANLRNILTRTKSLEFILANLVTILIIIFIQIAVIIWVYSIFFIGNAMLYELPKILIVVFGLIIVFVTIGLFVGTTIRTESSMFFTLLILIFCFFLGAGKIIPLELISSDVLRFVATYLNPFFLAEAILRKIIIFRTGFLSIGKESLYLFVIFILVFGLTYIAESYQKRRYMFYLASKLRKK